MCSRYQLIVVECAVDGGLTGNKTAQSSCNTEKHPTMENIWDTQIKKYIFVDERVEIINYFCCYTMLSVGHKGQADKSKTFLVGNEKSGNQFYFVRNINFNIFKVLYF